MEKSGLCFECLEGAESDCVYDGKKNLWSGEVFLLHQRRKNKSDTEQY